MLKKIGYLNLFFILFMSFLMYQWIDFKNLNAFDWVVIVLYGILVIVFIVRVVITVIGSRES